MGYKVDNAIIMAAGTASRFAPISYERPKALIEVNGEILIERQIRQLREAGIEQIIVVVGYMKEHFQYLQDKFGVILVENNSYLIRNNHSSIYVAKDYLHNTYICSSDNYFSQNPFESEVDDAYYAALYAPGHTQEWCMTEDEHGYIDSVQIGGSNAWYMLGHVFWSETFSRAFMDILEAEYDLPETIGKLWESIFMEHLDQLKMKIRRYDNDAIFEFDTLDELRTFDTSYIDDTHSAILKQVSRELGCREKDLVNIHAFKGTDNSAAGMCFTLHEDTYQYTYETKIIQRI